MYNENIYIIYSNVIPTQFSRISWKILFMRRERVLNFERRGRGVCIPRFEGIVFVWWFDKFLFTTEKLCPCVTSYMNTLIEITKILSVYELGILECCRHEYAQRLETVDLFLFDPYECLIDQISFRKSGKSSLW